VDGGGGWLEAGTFLLPADHVYADETDGEALASELTRQEIENSPRHDTRSLRSKMNGIDIDTKRNLSSIGKRVQSCATKTPTG
jgi:hypothetical protein